jgi:hypothetical protein
MSDPVLKLQILARAELVLAQVRLQRAAKRVVLLSVAIVFALFGLGMFNFAGFYALSETQGPAVAALFVALSNLTVMVLLLLFARKVSPERNEERLAREIRELAHAEINRDVEQVRAELEQISADVNKIRSSIKAFSGTATNTLVPLMGTLTRVFKNL